MDGEKGPKMVRGLIPNGLIPDKAETIEMILDQRRWSIVEDRIAELLTYIQPTFKSEQRRHDIVSYLRRLISNTVPCLLLPLGSVPLKTYLPDGDIDLTAFGDNRILDNNVVNEVLKVLESEQNSYHETEFRVKQVEYIQAEVKILKCLVENYVIDISFNQISGLCTLCFLEEVDNMIGHNHFFKRSVLLIKAWCYYESRILGAQHGLLSTYALETLVIYIFVLYNGALTGPLEVLYRFLEFFSKFDWNNYCISLRGPVPINSLPDMSAKHPRKDCPELLLNDSFLDSCVYCYGSKPSDQENQEQPFVTKYINIVDPLRENNNLGRSISKANFFRIRSAFSFGAQRLLRLLDCPEEKLIAEIDFFFKNTWDRNGKGFWIPFYDLRARNIGARNPTRHESEERQQPQEVHRNPATNLSKSKCMVGASDESAGSEAESSKTYSISTSTMISDIKQANPMESAVIDQGQSSKHSSDEVTDPMKNEVMDQGQSSDHSSNEVHAMPHFPGVHAKTMASDTKQTDPMEDALVDQGQSSMQSSNEVPAMVHSAREESIQVLTPASSQHMHTPVSGGKGGQIHSASSMAYNSRGSSSIHEKQKQSFGKTSYGQRGYSAVHLNGASNSYYGGFGRGVNNQNHYLFEKEMEMQMPQEQNATMNSMETFRNPRPMNVNAPNYFDSYWGQNMPYPEDFDPFSGMEWFPGDSMPPYGEEFTYPYGHNMGAAHLDHENSDGMFWHEQYMNNLRLEDGDDWNFQPQQDSNRQMLIIGNSSVVPAGGARENQGLFSNEFGPSAPPFPFPMMVPFLTEGIDVLDGDYTTNYMNMRYGLNCLYGHPQWPLVPSSSHAPLMYLQLLEQSRWQFPHSTLPSANMNNMPQSFPMDPKMPSGPPFVGPHVGTDHQLGGASELPWNKSFGTGTYMPDPESYKQRFNSHEKERNLRSKTWKIGLDCERSNEGTNESERNLSPRYNSNERSGYYGQFSRRNDPPPHHFEPHTWQCVPHISGSSSNGGTSEQGEGSHSARNEQARLQRDSAGPSHRPSSSNNRNQKTQPIKEEGF